MRFRKPGDLAVVLVCAATVAPVLAADVSHGANPAEATAVGALELRVGRVITADHPNLLRSDSPNWISPEAFYLVQLDGPMTLERRAQLESAGVALGQYLPNYAYVANLAAARPDTLAALPFMVWVGDFDPAWKIDPQLGRREPILPERQEMAAQGLTQAVVVLFDGADPASAIDLLDELGATIISENLSGSQWLIDAIIGPTDAYSLAELNVVQFIEEAPQGSMRNNTNEWILQSNNSATRPVWNAGIHGEGMVAGLIDGTPRESHCAFDDSVSPGPSHRKFIGWRNAGASDSHGTHTAGTIAGDNTPYGAATNFDGLAFAAKISFSNVNPVYSSPSTLISRLNDAYADGARAHSNSWGDDGTTAYTTWCAQIDQHTYANEESLVAFAVTNLSTLKTPENSKNVLAVGASQDTPNQGNFCSGGRGPTADGRRKPEIYAPGCSTNSAYSGTTCGTTAFTGTSMACPAVTAGAVLARQYFVDGYYPTGAEVPGDSLTPSAALIRGVLINGAVDMTGISGYPSTTEGWGRMLLDNALYFAGDASKLYVEDVRNASGLHTGENAVYNFTVNSDSVPLRVTLVFTEPAAAVNASNPTINNLDLEVLAPGSTLYRGNVFTSGQSSTGGSADAKNTVEQVHRTSPAPGAYTVTIKGTGVNSGAQGYALVVTGDITTTACTAPFVSADPASASRCVGDSASFSVTASGSATLSYQWRKNTANIPGANNSTYTIPAVSAGDAGSYDCVVSNSCGSDTSAAATLSVTVGDLDGDGEIALSDLSIQLASFGVPSGASYEDGDLNGDGAVDLTDVSLLLAVFGASCP